MLNNFRTLPWFGFALFIISSCSFDRQLSIDDLKKYPLQQENGLRKEVDADGVHLEVVFHPKDLVIVQDVGLDDAKAWKEREHQLDGLDYFILRISRNEEEIENTYAGDQNKYNQIISYLSSGISEDLSLHIESKKFPLEGSAFLPSFGSSAATHVLLIFNSNIANIKEDFSIVFDDSMLGTGRNEFNFSFQDVAKCPRIHRN